jgi:tagatose 6-phosphate kinase
VTGGYVIGVVCLNPALDITHHVPAVDWSGVNRPDAVHARPGGKGLNVARALHALGVEVLVMGLVGGTTGEAVTTGLAALAVPSAFTWVRGETRRTFTVVDGRTGHAALFNEPGPVIAADGYAEFRDRYTSVLPGCAAMVLSGSLPPGLPSGTYAELTAMAAAAGVPVLLDAHGEALRLGAAAGPAIVKPNLAELEALAGRPLSGSGGSGPGGSGPGAPDRQAVAAAARELRASGPAAVVVSLGADGLYLDTGEGCWQAVPPAVVAGNATGAGDAAAAGLAHGLALGQPWGERLRHAVALGTAAALAPVAGEFSPADYASVRAGVKVTRAEDRVGDRAGGAGGEAGRARASSEAGVARGEAGR